MAAAFLLDAARVAYYVFEVYSSKKQSPRKHCRSSRSSKRTRRASPLKPQAAPTTAEKPLDLARYGFDNSLLVSLWRRILNPPVQHYGPVVRYRPTTCKPSSHPRTVEVLITPQELRVIAPALKHMTSILRPVFPPFIRPVTCILDGNQCFTTVGLSLVQR